MKLNTLDLEIRHCKPRSLKLNTHAQKLNTENLKSNKLDTPYLGIGHGRFETFILSTIYLKIRDGRPKICQIEHPKPSNYKLNRQTGNPINWTFKTLKLDTLYLGFGHGRFETFNLDMIDLKSFKLGMTNLY